MPAVAAYRATVYRWQQAGVNSAGQPTGAWSVVAAELACDRQPREGRIDRQPFGAVGEQVVDAWFDSGLDVRIGDGVSFTEGPGIATAENFVVRDRQDWGAPGDLELVLEQTGESFG